MSKILLVDDDEGVRPTLKAIVDHIGHTPYVAVDGLDALALIRNSFSGTERIDLIISDILMPNMAGPEFLKYLRDHKELGYSHVPAFLLSGYGHTKYSRLINELGVKVLEKPIMINDLEREINLALRMGSANAVENTSSGINLYP